MGNSIDDLAGQVSDAFLRKARRFARGSLFIKLILVVVCSGLVSAAQFLQIPDDAKMTAVQAAGVILSIVVCLGALYLAVTEEDASVELALAHKALEEARLAEDPQEVYDFYDELVQRQIALYQSFNAMRSGLETIVISNEVTEGFCQTLLDLAGVMLPVALGLRQEDRWTICIYKAEVNESGYNDLKCVAHLRRIQCDISKARSWREGVGVVGISFANRQEVIVPDMSAAQLGTIFNLASDTRDYDSDRYRSMAAAPIKIEGQKLPWGVVVATNDRVNHFDHLDETGLQTAEGVRLIAGLLAIAAGAQATKPKPTSPDKI